MTGSFQSVLECVGGMGKIHHRFEGLTQIDPFHATRDALELPQAAFQNGRFKAQGTDGYRRSRKNVADVEFTH